MRILVVISLASLVGCAGLGEALTSPEARQAALDAGLAGLQGAVTQLEKEQQGIKLSQKTVGTWSPELGGVLGSIATIALGAVAGLIAKARADRRKRGDQWRAIESLRNRST